MENPWLDLTAAQRGIWFAHELDPTSPAYSTAEVVELKGDVDAERLQTALARAYEDFEQLRVRFRAGPDGPQQQVVAATVALRVAEVADEREAQLLLDADLAIPLDLSAGEVVRSTLVRVGQQRSWWYHCAHHVVLDGYGFVQLARRVADHYSGRVKQLRGATLAEVVAADVEHDADEFWDSRLTSTTTSLARAVAGPAPRALRHAVDLPLPAQLALKELSSRVGAPWPDVAVAACAGYLGRVLNQPSVRLGVPVMNRSAPGGGSLPSARTVCTAVNVLPVPADVKATTSVGELVAQITTQTALVREHSFTRQESLARRSGGQLFGPQVNLMPFGLRLDLDGVAGTVRNLSAGPVEDMTWTLRGVPGRPDGMRFEVDANPLLYEPDQVRRHADRLLHWLAVFSGSAPDAPVAGLPLLDETERELVLEGFNDTAVALSPRTLPQAFAEQVRRTPATTALRFAGEERTYAELDAEVERMSVALAHAGVRRGDVVGVALDRGLPLLAAVHAAHRTGAAYLPLDASQPRDRLADMLADASAEVVLTTTGTDVPGTLLHVDALPPVAGPVPERLAPELDDVAYVLFTSGSTGRPKGVQVTHRAIDNRLAWMQAQFGLQRAERVLHKTPITFDVSVWELFWPLQVGGTLVIAEPDGHRDPRYLATLLVDEGVTTLHFVPSMLRAFLADPASVTTLAQARVRHLVCSGEALTADLAADAAKAFGVAPTNLYGPTEAAVDVTCWQWDDARDAQTVPIGRPIWNTRCYVLDAQRRPLPVDVPGELWLAGVQLAVGYASRPELTAERFVADPFVPGERMYATGDLARWRGDGALVYLGREDGQVKVRGQRVELGEIETVLLSSSGVAEVAVVLQDEQLVAHVVPVPGHDAHHAVRDSARTRLPTHMVPAHVLLTEQLPRTSSGKLDRRALAVRELPSRAVDAHSRLPASLAEKQVAELMGALLPGGRPLAMDEDFFSSGGHSLLALRLVAALEQVTGSPARLADVFAAPTPSGLAARLALQASESGSDLDPLLVLRRGAGVPVFALPPAGGLGWCYLPLLRHLSTPLQALQSLRLDGSPAPASLRSLAVHYLSQIRSVVGRGPFHLVGWSIGGMAAHEVAAQAVADGQQVGAVVLLDAYPADQWSHLAEPTPSEALRGVLRMTGIETDEELDRVRAVELLGTGGSVLAGLPEAVLEASLQSVLDGTRMIRTGTHQRLAHDVVHVRATAPRPETWLDPAGWQAHLTGRLVVHDLETTHAGLLAEPFLGRVAELLAEEIARYGG